MAKRRVKKKTTKKPSASPANSKHSSDLNELQDPIEKEEDTSVFQEVERQIGAVRVIRDVETGRLVNALRLLRSNFNKEQLQMPLLKFLEENLPNVKLVSSTKAKINECQWKEKGLIDGGNMNSSLLHRLSIAYPHLPFDGYEFSSKTVKPSFLDADNLHDGDFVKERSSQMLGLRDGLQTPGGCYSSQRISAVGMTPKTLRLPKKGEMLLSVHGSSPLGVFNKIKTKPTTTWKLYMNQKKAGLSCCAFIIDKLLYVFAILDVFSLQYCIVGMKPIS